MKRILGLTVAFAALLIFVGCEETITLIAPVVDYAVADSGATLSLTWDEVDGADGYIIYADGEVVDTVTTASYDATAPAMVYAVSAYEGEDNESATDEVDCEPVVTANLAVYGLSDPATDHHSGLGFNTSGTAVTYSVVAANYDALDFVFDDRDPLDFLNIVSPDGFDPAFNDESNTTAASSTTSFDALDIAAAPGNYASPRELADDAVYSLWIDPSDDNWDDTEDHFGKMKIESLTGTVAPFSATVTVAYQPIAGLRWLVTE